MKNNHNNCGFLGKLFALAGFTAVIAGTAIAVTHFLKSKKGVCECECCEDEFYDDETDTDDEGRGCGGDCGDGFARDKDFAD